jgi:DNA-binding transcriptional MerR regulator
MAEIDISKLTKLYYSIGELAAMLEVNTSLLRFWEKEFEFQVGKKNAKGNRMYGIKEIAFINHVYQLVKIQCFTLDGAKHQLNAYKPNAELQKQKKQQEIIERLESIKQRLLSL